MGEVIQLVRIKRKRSPQAVKALRVLLNKAKAGEIIGFAFVALKLTGPCAGIINIDDPIAALDAAESLIDALRGDRDFIIPLDT